MKYLLLISLLLVSSCTKSDQNPQKYITGDDYFNLREAEIKCTSVEGLPEMYRNVYPPVAGCYLYGKDYTAEQIQALYDLKLNEYKNKYEKGK